VSDDEPSRTGDERSTLLFFLNWQRATLRRKCEGLDDRQLRLRSVEPSSLSLLGLVRHMSEGEVQWFREVLAGEDAVYHYSSDDNPNGEFDDVDAADTAEAFDTWRAECAHTDEIISRRALDATGRQDSGGEVSLRWILTHMIEEYSRHNGHADLLRERIDGATGY
jgi:uncharacterized damage-inducible protein DinB